MGRDLFDTWEVARQAFEEMTLAAGFDVAAVCFEESGRALGSTAAAQPALLAVELAGAALLRQAGIEPAAVAGHSLGEFAAWAVSGAISRGEVARLVAERGRLMEQAAQRVPGAMAALLGIAPDEAEQLCRQAARTGVVVPANFNAPGQVVVSGERAAVEEAGRLAQERGAKVRLLEVAGGFHSPLMAAAAERFARRLGEVNALDPAVPVAANATGDWVRTADEVLAAAAAQMTGPVRWQACVRRMVEAGITRFYEVGPGRVLAGLVRRIEPGAEVIAAGDAESLRAIVG